MYEMDLQWNEFNIAAIIFFIHQMLTFLLLIMNVMHNGSEAKHPIQDLCTALGFVIEAFSVVLLSICLNTEHNPHFFVNRERIHVHGGMLSFSQHRKRKSTGKKRANVRYVVT